MSQKHPTVTTKHDSNLAPGDVVSGLESSELVEIQRVAPFGGKTLVEGVGRNLDTLHGQYPFLRREADMSFLRTGTPRPPAFSDWG